MPLHSMKPCLSLDAAVITKVTKRAKIAIHDPIRMAEVIRDWVPEHWRAAFDLVNYLRDESTLPKKIQELAMLVTAYAMDCQFIWNAHAARGRREGLSDALVDALHDKHPPLPADEATVVHYGMEFFTTHTRSEAEAIADMCYDFL